VQETRLAVLVLQHPQEQDVDLGTARLLTLQLARGVLRVGLSWPNLAKALGPLAKAGEAPDPRRWAVLYMGSGDDVTATPRGGLRLVDRKGASLPDEAEALAGLDGIVLLDGSWSQAKALWWRNAWLLKLRRLVIHPDFRSAYGELRREPRQESVSTLEAAAFALSRLEERPELLEALTAPFKRLVAAYRASGRRAGAGEKRPGRPGGRPGGRWRGRRGAGKAGGKPAGGAS